MSQVHLKKIEDLLHLDASEVIKYEATPLTAPGENYGSLILRVDITVRSSKGEEKIYAVAKMLPTSERAQEFFNTKITFRAEIVFYNKILPLLQNFQKEQGVEEVIDFSPRYYGSRLNLNCDDSKVDSDAVLLLENLNIDNYKTLDQKEGMSLDVAELILADLAHLHAVPLALKLKKRDLFETDIRPYLSLCPFDRQFHDIAKSQLDKAIRRVPELLPLRERILEGFERESEPVVPREPFATMRHEDSWTNNTMVKFEGEKAVRSKLVDFPLCTYGSPAGDVLFFLFSSVKPQVLEKYYDHFVQFYHKTFTSILQKLDIDTGPFSFEAFEKELDLEATSSQFGHALYMLFVIFAPRESVVEMSVSSPDDVLYVEPTDLLLKKLVFIVREFEKRNWI